MRYFRPYRFELHYRLAATGFAYHLAYNIPVILAIGIPEEPAVRLRVLSGLDLCLKLGGTEWLPKFAVWIILEPGA